MQATQKQAIEAYQRVHHFLNNHPPPADRETLGYRKQKAILDGIVEDLSAHAVGQSMGRRLRAAERVRQRALRRVLREEHLWPISQIARALLSEAPGIERALTLPGYRVGTTRLVAEARAIRRAVEPYKEQLIDAGRPEDFLARLDAATDAVEASVDGKVRALDQQVGGTAGLEAQIRRGRQVVTILDTIVRDVFRGDEEVLAKWRIAKRVRRVPGAARSETPTETPVAAEAGNSVRELTERRLVYGESTGRSRTILPSVVFRALRSMPR